LNQYRDFFVPAQFVTRSCLNRAFKVLGKTTGNPQPFGGFFADSRPCVFAPDPVSLLPSSGPPIL
jgi:hypothetical protein